MKVMGRRERVEQRSSYGLQTAPETDWLMFKKKFFLILESIKDL